MRKNGPIYIGRGAAVQEGAMVRGNHVVGDYAPINMGTRMRGDSSIGPYAKVGGEITNSVIHSFSNKCHEGYLGNSVLGSYCNLGADTNVSNLKNTYGAVKQWSYRQEKLISTGKTFCGAVFGAVYPPKFIPSFSWGGASGLTTYDVTKAIEVATTVKSRRNLPLTLAERRAMEEIYVRTAIYRQWEKEKV